MRARSARCGRGSAGCPRPRTPRSGCCWGSRRGTRPPLASTASRWLVRLHGRAPPRLDCGLIRGHYPRRTSRIPTPTPPSCLPWPLRGATIGLRRRPQDDVRGAAPRHPPTPTACAEKACHERPPLPRKGRRRSRCSRRAAEGLGWGPLPVTQRPRSRVRTPGSAPPEAVGHDLDLGVRQDADVGPHDLGIVVAHDRRPTGRPPATARSPGSRPARRPDPGARRRSGRDGRDGRGSGARRGRPAGRRAPRPRTRCAASHPACRRRGRARPRSPAPSAARRSPPSTPSAADRPRGRVRSALAPPGSGRRRPVRMPEPCGPRSPLPPENATRSAPISTNWYRCSAGGSVFEASSRTGTPARARSRTPRQAGCPVPGHRSPSRRRPLPLVNAASNCSRSAPVASPTSTKTPPAP